MGMQITNSTAFVHTQTAYRRTTDATSYGEDTSANTALFGAPRKEEPLKLGFGKGTVSPGVAAVRTLDTNLTKARQLVPTVEELQEQARQRAQEAHARLEEETPATEPYTYDFQGMRVRASEQAINYINQLNDAAATAQARLNGEPLPNEQPFNVRIGDEMFNLGVAQGGFRLDVRV